MPPAPRYGPSYAPFALFTVTESYFQNSDGPSFKHSHIWSCNSTLSISRHVAVLVKGMAIHLFVPTVSQAEDVTMGVLTLHPSSYPMFCTQELLCFGQSVPRGIIHSRKRDYQNGSLLEDLQFAALTAHRTSGMDENIELCSLFNANEAFTSHLFVCNRDIHFPSLFSFSSFAPFSFFCCSLISYSQLCFDLFCIATGFSLSF